ncbi:MULTISPECIES: hypothetical protein [unclassified Mucilaginibacter]|uniref:hypothetical protein n=1 Tax=unclassified Mucilaginibacter TaxID=2617802 RepID=UPI002AC924F7|nr:MULTISPECIES: hypothetical protein [unclassified Mucilaginibacter]MEB0263389.1 hypothetical protein [Mucilaginibacter sp. 10I4]MEB0278582.1 hypothetical protein [Mucilaginibacter sp. 10B2]MEB0299292.1 hypothetical protein [Mucilaginibacter sp. 5C4]WPX23463.1 hypothetical protein RHM67_19495 [Mucilaginibacter sp. 5C4]
MSAQKVLNEDWSEYDNRKKKWEDRLFFSCEESWEVDYLVRQMKKHFPYTSEQTIRNAIASCCQTVKAPRPRKEFVECVSSKL